jgi:hypothetical protein
LPRLELFTAALKNIHEPEHGIRVSASHVSEATYERDGSRIRGSSYECLHASHSERFVRQTLRGPFVNRPYDFVDEAGRNCLLELVFQFPF